MSDSIRELRPEELRAVCDPHQFPFKSTEAVEPITDIIGQERAVRAIHFGLGMQSFGYNIYVAGLPGTGKNFAVKMFLTELSKKGPVPPDWCYVHNFQDRDRPRVLELPAGKACELAQDMQEVVRDLRAEIPKIFEGEEYTQHQEDILREFREKRDALLTQLTERAAARSFVIKQTPLGLATFPVRHGQPLSEEEFGRLSESEQRALLKQKAQLDEEMNATMRQLRSLEKEAKDKMQGLERAAALRVIGLRLYDLFAKYETLPHVVEYLKAVQEDILANLEDFKTPEAPPAPPAAGGPPPSIPKPSFERYEVNVLVDNSKMKGAPVIEETNPTYANLFGRIERRVQYGALVTNFTLIKPGSLHRANGGYLILNVDDVLRTPLVWEALKRAIENREIRIDDWAEHFGFITTETLRPEPIPLNAKILLIGNPMLYHLLYALDEDFRNLFKVKADFDLQMDRTPEHIDQYTRFISARCRDENLKHFDPTGVAAMIEFASRTVEDQEKLSTRFVEIADLIREAHYWAARNAHDHVTAEDVETAVEEKVYRSNLLEEKIQELFRRGTLLVDTDDEKTGVVNGLSVYELGDYSFGKPTRITANVHLGRRGVVNIERESELSGKIHTKGVMILSGYLAGKYATDKPLSLSATLAFEQSYEEVEGDSASSAELYALLSALSGLPVRQGIAVTGSVNQKGEIQPIGGVNKKIEGFFAVCKMRGLTGKQGVMIPIQNVRNLMLKREVVEAVRDGKFHIWPVATVEEGIEILTGLPAGLRKPDGTWEEGTVNYRVDMTLREFARQMRDLGAKGEEVREPL